MTLDIELFTHARYLLKLGLNLQELSLYVEDQSVIHSELLNEWARLEFRPARLNIIVYQLVLEMMVRRLIKRHQQWSSKVPVGHTALLKIYPRYKMPLNLSPVVPVFELYFGKAVVLPFVQAEQCGIQGLDYLQLTDCSRGGKIVSMTKALLDYCPQFYTVDNINCLRYFNVGEYNSLLPNDLEQIAIACPNLQQLKISKCCKSLTGLHGLQAVANYCQNLQGLNMIGISVSAVESQIQLWEILSKMTLTHLAVDYCIITPSAGDAVYKNNFTWLVSEMFKAIGIGDALLVYFM